MILALLLALTASAAPYPAVRTDARVELLGAVRLLAGDASGSSGFYRRDGAYEKALAARLSPLARHPVVERWQELEKAGLPYVPAYQWILTLGPVPGLAAGAPAPEALSRAAGGAAGVEEFRLLLADFAAASRFDAAYAELAPLREPLADSVRAQAETLGVRRDVEKWSGLAAPEHELIVSPFVEPAIAVTAVSGGKLTSLSGPEEFEGKVVLRLATRRGTLWAEELREMLRPAHEAAKAGLKASRALFAPVAGRCAPDWEECALREIAFAGAGRLLARAGDKAASDELPVKYARVGMPHIGALMKELEKCKDGRLAACYPRLAASFAPGESPFSGSMGDALADGAPCVVLASPALKEAAAAFARTRRVCEPAGASAAGRGLVVAGGLSENAWLRERWKDLRLPLSFDGADLAFNPRPGEAKGRRLTGRLAVATSARNPDDPSRPALVFAAPDAEGAARAMAAFDPAFDYQVFDGTAAVKSGLYEKSRLPWRVK